MQAILQAALPSLANDLEYKVEPISAVDFYYTDGLAVGSFLKLVVQNTSIYLFPSGLYIPCGHLTQEQKSILDGWVETCRSQKLNSEASAESIAQNTK
jgi:hypothetical protein